AMSCGLCRVRVRVVAERRYVAAVAEQDAQRGQEGTQLVVLQRLDGCAECEVRLGTELRAQPRQGRAIEAHGISPWWTPACWCRSRWSPCVSASPATA